MTFRPIPDPELATGLRALAAGEPVVLLCQQPQIVCAARGIDAERINLMAQHGRGLICHAMAAEQMVRLGLRLLPSTNERADRWRFATSYEAAEGCTTGISAGERAITLNAGARDGAEGCDIAQPGHIIPVLANPRGVTAPDLALWLMDEAGIEGGAAICTLLDGEGAVAGRDECVALAAALGLAVIDAPLVPGFAAQARQLETVEARA